MYLSRSYILFSVLLIDMAAATSFADIPCFEISTGKSLKTKIICCKGKTPGFADEDNAKETFVSLKEKKKQALKNNKVKKVQVLREILKTAKPHCINSNKPGENATPTPTSTPNPQATSTPQAIEKNFDDQGNVTNTGKDCFQIPTELSANALTGAQEVSNRCVTCHGQNLLDVPNTVLFDRAFPFIRTRTKTSPMNFDEQSLPDSVLADITAFLNRFRNEDCN